MASTDQTHLTLEEDPGGVFSKKDLSRIHIQSQFQMLTTQ